MRISSTAYKKPHQPLSNFPIRSITTVPYSGRRRKEKVVVVMGATGTGKSRLSIDLATHFLGEIINSDKMQVYKGLDIATNKVTKKEQCGIPHHLLGVINPDVEFTAYDFRHLASLAIESIVGRNRLPIIVGGSNSYIEALVNDKDELKFRSKYDCCFLWVDVLLPVLHSFVSDRVDRMVEAGLVEEVSGMFEPEADYTRGIRRAIGVPEMDRYLRAKDTLDQETRSRLLEAAIDEIKANNCKLACCQLQKIHRLRTLLGWNVHRIDATEVFLKRGREANEAWENLVMRPSTRTVGQFLYNEEQYIAPLPPPPTVSTIPTTVLGKAVAAATH